MMRTAVLFFLTLASGAAQVVEAQKEPARAAPLLQQMEARYAAIRSYSDTTSAIYRNPDGAEGASAQCQIWFSRPSFFRIDGESRRAPDAPPRRDVMWSDGETARSWSTSRAVALLGKIQLAGSKMFGTYAYHIPTLLERSYGGEQRLNQIENPTLAGEEIFEDVACYRIRGEWQRDPYEIWLGKTDSLVRKIIANYKGYVMEETHRDIAVDRPIPKKIFEFAPENDSAAPTK